MEFKTLAKQLLPPILHQPAREIYNKLANLYVSWYLQKKGRIPWGYKQYKIQFIAKAIRNDEYALSFNNLTPPLPINYGMGLDEHCIEYPWFFSKASVKASQYLIMGSSLTDSHILAHPFWRNKKISILTTGSEKINSIYPGISYIYTDYSNLPFRTNLFDEITSLSSLQYVGMTQANEAEVSEMKMLNHSELRETFSELKRVLKPGGRLLFSVPFGKYQNLNLFQQFDIHLLNMMAKVFKPSLRLDNFFKYYENGWHFSSLAECKECSYYKYSLENQKKPEKIKNLSPGAQAVVCCVWYKD